MEVPEEEEAEEAQLDFNGTSCPDCGKGKVLVSDLGVRKLSRCQHCNWWKSEKI